MKRNSLYGCRGAFRSRLGKWTLFTALLALVGAVPALYAQQYSGTIVGTVADQAGAVVPGAAITIINTGTNQTANVKSDEQGNFTAAQLPVGTYDVHVKQGNFEEYIQT